jgi:peptide/nickel transport system permease protein
MRILDHFKMVSRRPKPTPLGGVAGAQRGQRAEPADRRAQASTPPDAVAPSERRGETGHLPLGAARPYLPTTPGNTPGEQDGPVAAEQVEERGDSRVYVASQWKLMWWRFRKNKLAMLGAAVMVGLYLTAIFAELLAPFPAEAYAAQYTYAPPQRLHLIDRTGGGFRFSPYVNGYRVEVDPESLRRRFTIDPSTKFPVRLFARGSEYRLLGLFPTDIHLLKPVDPGKPMFLLGADRMGRDVFSRLIHGTRISLSIGLVGIAISTLLGILLGGISGYYGGAVDNVIQRFVEFLIALPTLPLWMGLSAALPPRWSPLRVYFGITVILSLIAWTGLARVVRGRFLSLREEDFVTAARLDGSGELRIIVRHMLPSFASHIIAGLTLAIPGMILGETALSFLGLGLRPPVVSWGVLLNEAQNIRAIATAPWLLSPTIAVMITVMALYFLGDGLRDAADPYAV